jgi:hypothetical protein
LGDERSVDAVGLKASCVEMGAVRQETSNTVTVLYSRKRVKLFLFICNTPATR